MLQSKTSWQNCPPFEIAPSMRKPFSVRTDASSAKGLRQYSEMYSSKHLLIERLRWGYHILRKGEKSCSRCVVEKFLSENVGVVLSQVHGPSPTRQGKLPTSMMPTLTLNSRGASIAVETQSSTAHSSSVSSTSTTNSTAPWISRQTLLLWAFSPHLSYAWSGKIILVLYPCWMLGLVVAVCFLLTNGCCHP